MVTVTFVLVFSYVNEGPTFDCLGLPTSYLVRRYIFRIFQTNFEFKGHRVKGKGHSSKKRGSV